MSVLVTGGAGYIGSHMVLALCEAGESVVVLDNLSTGFKWAIDKRANFIKGNAGDVELVSKIIIEHNIKEIVHFAGSIIVPESVVDPLKYYENNTATTRNLLEAAVREKVKHFIFSSTAAVYGMVGTKPVSEETPLKPASPYGRSKLMSEMMLEDVSNAHPITYGALRYFNVAGADASGHLGQSMPNATHLIKVAIQAALKQRKHIDVYGTDYETPDGTCLRDYIHISDLINAHSLLLNHLRNGGKSEILNCGYGRGYSVTQVIKMVKKVSDIDFKVNEVARRAGDPACVVASSEKLKNLLNWQPQNDDLEKIIASAYDWEKHLMKMKR